MIRLSFCGQRLGDNWPRNLPRQGNELYGLIGPRMEGAYICRRLGHSWRSRAALEGQPNLLEYWAAPVPPLTR
jgi:hypothetical protein